MNQELQNIIDEVEKRYNYWREKDGNSHSIESECRMSECHHLLLMLNSKLLQVIGDLQWEAHLNGEKETKEQLLKNTITAEIQPANYEETAFCFEYDTGDEVELITRMVEEGQLKLGDKIKLVVIKED